MHCPKALTRASRLLILLSVVCLTACAPQPADLRISNGAEPSILDPQISTGLADARVLSALFEGLTRLDSQTLQPIPGLATHWTTTPDHREWAFHLRENAKWSNGQSLTPQDVIASWKRLQNPNTAAPYADWLSNSTFYASGPVIHIQFKYANWNFAEQCAWPALAPIPQKLRDGETPALEFGQISSGPYQLDFRRLRDRIRLKSNTHYWRAKDVQIQTIDFFTVESNTTALNLFLTKDIHYTAKVPPLAVPALRLQHASEFITAPQFATCFLRFQTQQGPLTDPSLRKALSLAIDREAMISVLGAGCRPAERFVPPDLTDFQHEPKRSMAFSPNAARDALAECTYDDSIDGPLEFLFPSSPRNRILAEFLQDQWRQNLGLDIRLSNQEWKTFLTAQRGLQYQISRSSWVGDYLAPETFLSVFQSGSGNNRTGWKNKEYDQSLLEAKVATTPHARFAALLHAEDILLNEHVILPLYHDESLELVSPDLIGLHQNLRGWIDWSTLSFQEKSHD